MPQGTLWTDPALSLLSLPGCAASHPSLAAAVAPAVFNGKDSPKHQQLAKTNPVAVARPLALGRLACPGVLLSLGQGVMVGEGGSRSHCAVTAEPPGLLEGESGLGSRWPLSLWGCAPPSSGARWGLSFSH